MALRLEAVGHPAQQVEEIARLHLTGLLALLPHVEDAAAACHIDDVVLLSNGCPCPVLLPSAGDQDTGLVGHHQPLAFTPHL
jgi:hypothetical protein